MIKIQLLVFSLLILSERFCALRKDDRNPLERLRRVNKAEIRRFMHWYLDHHNVTRLDSFYVLMRYWRMMYARRLYKTLDYILASDMKAVSRYIS